MAGPQQQQQQQEAGAQAGGVHGGGEDPWDPQQHTLRADPYQQDYYNNNNTANTSYDGAGIFERTGPPVAGHGQGRAPVGIRSGRQSPTSDQPRPGGPRPSNAGHVQIQPQLPNPRAGAASHAHNTSIPSKEGAFENTFAYPPHYPNAPAEGMAGPFQQQQQQQQQGQHQQQASGSTFSRFKRPDAQTYKSNSSADWARLLGRAGYAAAPQHEDGAQDPSFSGQAQQFRGPGTKAAPTYLCCLPLTIDLIKKVIFIFCVTAVLWVPGIVALTAYNAGPHNNYNRPRVWKVGIMWWSVWLSSIWVGWFVAHWLAKLVPRLLGGTVGAFSMEIKHYIQYLTVLAKYIALFAWTILVWISWLAVIWNNFQDPARYSTPTTTSTNSSGTGLSGLDPNALFNSTTILGDSSITSTYNLMVTLTHLWFGLIICAALLLTEKFLIQVIALSFHEVSYADRLAQNKLHVEILTTLYDHALRTGFVSSAASSRPGTPTKGLSVQGKTETTKSSKNGKRSLFDYERPHLRRSRRARSEDELPNNNSIMGVVASELGTETQLAARDFRLRFRNGVPIPTKTSPRTAVLVALCSASETRKLCYRIFRAFSHWEPAEEGTDEVLRVMTYADISRFFSTSAAARVAWELIDKDLNGSVTEEELLAAGQEVHRERDTLMNSMRDIDSAVGRLDQVFTSFFSIISVVIVAGLISVKFQSLVTSFGTVLLGLSWLLSSTAQEALSAIIFLFIKHPYDVGDRVQLDGGSGTDTYTVAEIALLSTVFKTTTGKYVQISHSVLTTKMVTNLRRSGPTEESLTFDVPYSTTFEQIEQLRERMIEWIDTQPRDFFPGLNIAVVNLPEFKTMTLQTAIRFKSNGQAGALRTMRKNRWMCRFKEVLSETGIALPDAPSTSRVTLIPYPPPESETTKPTPAEALAGTRGTGAGDVLREYNFLDAAVDVQDARALDTRAVRQGAGAMPEGVSSGTRSSVAGPGSGGYALGGPGASSVGLGGADLRRRNIPGDEA